MYISSESLNLLQATIDIFSDLCKAVIVVFNSEGYRIAATDHFKTKINDWGPENYPALVCIRTKQRIYIEKPTQHPLCQGCIYLAVCDKKHALHIPLMRDEQARGTLSILWYWQSNPEDYENYLQYLELALTSMLHNDMLLDARYQQQFLKTDKSENLNLYALGNMIEEGVMLLDSNNCIREINECAALLIEKPRYTLIGKHISLFFPDLPSFGVPEQFHEPFTCSGPKKRYNLRCTTKYLTRIAPKDTLLIVMNIVDVMEAAVSVDTRITFKSILGKSKALRGVLTVAEKVAKTDSTILIRGESGTGKELVARAIHNTSARSEGPFVALNCSAIPDELMESELFGYEAGTFTGALKGGKDGLLQSANNGTLFLDEIGDMSYHLQAKLLRALEGRRVQRIGSSIETPVNLRIIAATNQNLEKMMENNEFRSDLFYRLNIIPIMLPPLRERKEDIELLVDYFVAFYSKKCTRRVKGYMPGVIKLFRNYDWPGNIRELQNIVEYAVNIENGEYISLETVSSRFPSQSIVEKPVTAGQQAERNEILEKLNEYGNSVAGKRAAAKELGISLATLYRKLAEAQTALKSKE